MAAALAGECSTLDTVVYTCCDMLNACELASDVERATQWCQAADDFVETYGCPFLYAECRISYGSVLTAKGRWADAERELDVGLRITQGTCPALHGRALTRLAGAAGPPGSARGGGAPAARCGPERRGRGRGLAVAAPRCCWRGATPPPPAGCSSSDCATSRSTARTSAARSTCSSMRTSPPATSTAADAAAERLDDDRGGGEQRAPARLGPPGPRPGGGGPG